MSHKTVLTLQQMSRWTSNVNSAGPSGLAKFYHLSELSVLITSLLKIKLMPE